MRALNQEEIKAILPHRTPFLFLDGVTDFEPGKYAHAYAVITGEENYFTGHFPGYPVMPGVLIVESLAQCGAVALLSLEDFKGRIAFLAGVDKARFKRQVRPGDRLDFKVEVIQLRSSIGRAKAEATCQGDLCVSCEIMFALADGV